MSDAGRASAICCELASGVAHLVLYGRTRATFTPDLLSEFAEAKQALATNRTVRGVVLAAESPRSLHGQVTSCLVAGR